MAPVKHGHARKGALTPEYRAWAGIKTRCEDPTNAAYPYYGGRGITLCARWQDFRAFLLDVGERPSRALTLERVDNDRGYEPGNVVWASRKAQARNRRSNKLVTYKGETMPVAALAERAGVPYMVLWKRLFVSGLSLEEALTRPVRAWNRH
jgi:hypothetical protein